MPINFRDYDEIVVWGVQGQTLTKDILCYPDEIKDLNISILSSEDNSYRNIKRLDITVSLDDYKKVWRLKNDL